MKKDLRIYALHVHGDYSMEWIKCLSVEQCGKDYLIKTVLLPNGIFYYKLETQLTQSRYMLMDK